MKIYQYKDEKDYRKAQIEANLAKQDWVWVKERDIEWIHSVYPDAKRILCHGTRNGAEQKFFLKYYPDAYVMGTEIGPKAREYPNTIRHDFNKSHHKLNNFDIVYSNSLDHSPDPEKTLTVWKNQLSENGSIFVEIVVAENINKSSYSDPLEWDNIEEFDNIVEKIGMRKTNALAGYTKDELQLRLIRLVKL